MGGELDGELVWDFHSPTRHVNLGRRRLISGMGSIADLVSGICLEVEAQLKPNLRGFFGGTIRTYLPQAWVFTTETETVTLKVDPEGNVSVHSGRDASPDVIIQGTHAALSAALSTRNPAKVPPGSIKARPVTSKGSMAFNFLRNRFGL